MRSSRLFDLQVNEEKEKKKKKKDMTISVVNCLRLSLLSKIVTLRRISYISNVQNVVYTFFL